MVGGICNLIILMRRVEGLTEGGQSVDAMSRSNVDFLPTCLGPAASFPSLHARAHPHKVHMHASRAGGYLTRWSWTWPTKLKAVAGL